ncbi:MAG: hypothetical protein IJJ44_05105 [Solobacterium sp.]|nr:hypothetical protein [Solobacterium sp.]
MIAREYVDVVIHFDKEGNALPVFIYLDGKRYKCKKFGPITREPKVGKGVWKYIVTTPLGLISLYREKDLLISRDEYRSLLYYMLEEDYSVTASSCNVP